MVAHAPAVAHEHFPLQEAPALHISEEEEEWHDESFIDDHEGHNHGPEAGRDYGEDYALTFVEPLDALLIDYVKKGQKEEIKSTLVDYANWADDERHYIAMGMLEAANLNTLKSKEEILAFWINAYNILTIDLIIKEKEKKSIKNLGGLLLSPWKAHSWTVAGQDVTLDDIEHKILRKLEEPRIHFAINCASLSCPNLREESYRPHQLNAQLNDQTRTFLLNPQKGLKIQKNNLYVSSIFKWFEEDFENVHHFLKQYQPIEGEPEILYLAYNWNLNGSW